MTVRRLDGAAIRLPVFPVPEPSSSGTAPQLFALTSHERAREALDFGLFLSEPGFNIFVVGEDRTGRMTATLEFLFRHARGLKRQNDWVYLNNFSSTNRPIPIALEPSGGKRLRAALAALVAGFRNALPHAFEAPDHVARIRRRGEKLQEELEAGYEALSAFAREHGVALQRTSEGIMVRNPEGDEATSRHGDDALAEVDRHLREFDRRVRAASVALDHGLDFIRREAAAEALGPLIDPLFAEFGDHPELGRWVKSLRADILDNLDLFLPAGKDKPRKESRPPEERYAVNILVDHSGEDYAPVVIEATPSYENLFGKIEYRSGSGVAETDFTLIRAGALHRANGGILVLRAEAVARYGDVWTHLKGALRDGLIRIEELHREGGPPMAGAPNPIPIPLRVKVVIVGAPRWYQTFFSVDPEFLTYFKIKADIDPDMPADAANVAEYARLIQATARARTGRNCDVGAVQRLLGQAARWADDRRKLSAQFELVEDVVIEAAALKRPLPAAGEADTASITVEDVREALARRRRRNQRMEDRTIEAIQAGRIMIDTEGSRIGRINALVVRDSGNFAFGLPCRISARVFAGRAGIINIERDTDLGGPLQQKGVLIIGGYLSARFARRYPLSFGATLTFEQNYGGIEGDSASMAELLAILSALAEVPLRQDVAVTGSVNQHGESQTVGNILQKIEGFYRVCAERGLTGRQGVLVPHANETNILLREEIAEAVAQGLFHIWSMDDVDDALSLLTGLDPGRPDAAGRIPPNSIAARIDETLARYDATLRERLPPFASPG